MSLWPRAPLLLIEVHYAFVLPTKYGKCRQMNPLIAIYAWPIISVVLFNKYRLPVAALVCMLGGFLFLPETIAIDLPVLPSLDKYSIPVLATVVLGAMLAQNSPKTDVLKGWIPKSLLLRFLGIAFVFGAFMTVVTNRDPLVFPLITLPGLRFYDAFSAILSNIIFLLPMIAARKFLAKPEHHVLILIALAIAGFGYSFLALYEVRMSPQLNSIVYGFFPHSWVQHIRGGGYRPLEPRSALVTIFVDVVSRRGSFVSDIQQTKTHLGYACVALAFDGRRPVENFRCFAYPCRDRPFHFVRWRPDTTPYSHSHCRNCPILSHITRYSHCTGRPHFINCAFYQC